VRTYETTYIRCARKADNFAIVLPQRGGKRQGACLALDPVQPGDVGQEAASVELGARGHARRLCDVERTARVCRSSASARAARCIGARLRCGDTMPPCTAYPDDGVPSRARAARQAAPCTIPTLSARTSTPPPRRRQQGQERYRPRYRRSMVACFRAEHCPLGLSWLSQMRGLQYCARRRESMGVRVRKPGTARTRVAGIDCHRSWRTCIWPRRSQRWYGAPTSWAPIVATRWWHLDRTERA
jgi:hypothetical protein